MKGVGRLTQKEHRGSTTVKPDIQKSIQIEFVWSCARAVSVAAQGWISHSICWLWEHASFHLPPTLWPRKPAHTQQGPFWTSCCFGIQVLLNPNGSDVFFFCFFFFRFQVPTVTHHVIKCDFHHFLALSSTQPAEMRGLYSQVSDKYWSLSCDWVVTSGPADSSQAAAAPLRADGFPNR